MQLFSDQLSEFGKNRLLRKVKSCSSISYKSLKSLPCAGFAGRFSTSFQKT